MLTIESLDMPEEDLENLRFLLTSTPETLRKWYFEMEQDDIEYAFELLTEAESQLKDMQNDPDVSLELKAYLKKFMLQ
jgi:phage terminase Nu1 subunit (DNA packaging protein)